MSVSVVRKAWSCDLSLSSFPIPLEELCRDHQPSLQRGSVSAEGGQAWVVLPDWFRFILTLALMARRWPDGQMARQALNPPLQDALQGHSPTKTVTMAHLEVIYSCHGLISSSNPEVTGGKEAKSKHSKTTISSLRELLLHGNSGPGTEN